VGNDVEDGLDHKFLRFFPRADQIFVRASRTSRLPLLIRQEFDVINNLLNQQPKNYASSAIISGQPGMGELLLIFLVEVNRVWRKHQEKQLTFTSE
jgi:hypothetical protein